MKLIAALVAVATLAFAAPKDSQAFVIYDWHGECTINCSGIASGQLVLDDRYVPGQPTHCNNVMTNITDCEIVSWFYMDSGGALIHFRPNTGISYESAGGGTLPVTEGPAQFGFYAGASFIGQSFGADGSWRIFNDLPGLLGTGRDRHAIGINSVWTPGGVLPEPGVLALLAIAGVSLVAARMRR